jgi:hypothetical protein
VRQWAAAEAAQPAVVQLAVRRRLITPMEKLAGAPSENPMAEELQSENPMAEGPSKVTKNPVLAAGPRLQGLPVWPAALQSVAGAKPSKAAVSPRKINTCLSGNQVLEKDQLTLISFNAKV